MARKKTSSADHAALTEVAQAIHGNATTSPNRWSERESASTIGVAQRKRGKAGETNYHREGVKRAAALARGEEHVPSVVAPVEAKKRGRPKSQATIDREAKRASDIAKGLRKTGARGRPKKDATPAPAPEAK